MLLGARQRGLVRILRASEFLRFSAIPQCVHGGIPDHAVAPPHACMHTTQSSPAGGCLHGPCGPIPPCVMPSSCMHAHCSSNLTHPQGHARMDGPSMQSSHAQQGTEGCRPHSITHRAPSLTGDGGMPSTLYHTQSSVTHRGLRDAVHTHLHAAEVRHSPAGGCPDGPSPRRSRCAGT